MRYQRKRFLTARRSTAAKTTASEAKKKKDKKKKQKSHQAHPIRLWRWLLGKEISCSLTVFRQPGTWSAIVIVTFDVCCLTAVTVIKHAGSLEASANIFESSRESLSRCSMLIIRHHCRCGIELRVSTSPITSPGTKALTRTAIEMYKVIGDKKVSTERQHVIDSPRTCLCSQKHLCLFIVYILLTATVGSKLLVEKTITSMGMFADY